VRLAPTFAALLVVLAAGCGQDSDPGRGGGDAVTGGVGATGGTVAVTGGAGTTGGADTGSGGADASGGAPAPGGDGPVETGGAGATPGRGGAGAAGEGSGGDEAGGDGSGGTAPRGGAAGAAASGAAAPGGGGAGTGGVAPSGGAGGGLAGGGAGGEDLEPIPTGTPAEDEVLFNETVRLQTVDGVGADVYNFPFAGDQGWDWASVAFSHVELDVAYVRTAPWFAFWEPENDDADPWQVTWDAFGTADAIPAWHDLPYATYLTEQGIEVMPGIWGVADWMIEGDPPQIPPEDYPELGESIATYVRWLTDNGVPVPVAEVQNEPTIAASIQYPSPEALRDAALALLDQLDAQGLGDVLLHGPNVHMPEPTVEWARPWLENERLRARTAAISYHTWWQDDFEIYDGIRALGEEYGLPIWATEVGYCALAEGCFDGANYLLPETWGTAWDYALSHYRAFAWSHASRSYHWTLVGHDAAVGPTGERYPSYFVLRHFTNRIPPGARMLEVAAGDAELLPLAFLHPNGDVAVLLINQGTSEKALSLVSVAGQGYSPVDAWATTEAEYDGTAIVDGAGEPGRFAVVVAPRSLVSVLLTRG